MKISLLFSVVALIATVVAAGAAPSEEKVALNAAEYYEIEPHFGSVLSRRDDQSEANAEFVDLLTKRQSCPGGTGVCPNDKKRCCAVGGDCCPKKGCCARGKFCVGNGCCPDTQMGCDGKGCCPKNYNCCKGGSCCQPGTYCVRTKSGKVGCCPNGKLCYN
ncbi:hypothetical protein BGX28_009265 [Mortierella sp. GBA30]|nr:hypothetical protein BGX28_009265 [Mortierella sp. GBA30]